MDTNLKLWSEQDFPAFSENRDMKTSDFLNIPPIPVNRHVEERAIKKTIELLKPMAKHREVDLLRYTGPTVTKPALFRQGQTYVLDGNTRSYIWNTYKKGGVVNTKVDHTESPLPIPRQVNVRIYDIDNAEDAIELYYIIDSKDAVEEPAHKITGVYRANNLSNFKNRKIRRGQIATALNVACPINSKKTFSIYVNGVSDVWDQIPHLSDVLQKMDKLDAPGRGHFHVQPATGVAMLAGLACQCDDDWTRAVEKLAKAKTKLRETWQDEPDSNIHALIRGNVDNVVGEHNAMPYDIGFHQAPTIVLNYLSYCWINIIEGGTVESDITLQTIEGMYKNLVELAYEDLAKS